MNSRLPALALLQRSVPLASILLACSLQAGQPQAPAKKLIEFVWDEPDTRFLREHLSEMEQTPFDGCVFHANYPNPEGKQGSFTWEAWGTREFIASELQGALDDLKSL